MHFTSLANGVVNIKVGLRAIAKIETNAAISLRITHVSCHLSVARFIDKKCHEEPTIYDQD
jgi:hypothetical protein